MMADIFAEVEVVPVDPGGKVSATGPLTHICPYRDEVDEGAVKVVWDTDNGSTLELHSLAAYFAAFAEVQISHEDLTTRISDELEALDGPRIESVSTTWDTAGFVVTCST